jgi:nicotinamidase-related amidase
MNLNPQGTATLSLDIQEGILDFVTGAEAAIPNASRAVEAAKSGGLLLMDVGIGFEQGILASILPQCASCDYDR